MAWQLNTALIGTVPIPHCPTHPRLLRSLPIPLPSSSVDLLPPHPRARAPPCPSCHRPPPSVAATTAPQLLASIAEAICGEDRTADLHEDLLASSSACSTSATASTAPSSAATGSSPRPPPALWLALEARSCCTDDEASPSPRLLPLRWCKLARGCGGAAQPLLPSSTPPHRPPPRFGSVPARWLYQMKEKGKILSLWLETVVYEKFKENAIMVTCYISQIP
ncbi:proline-rich receptor-like protein kinase PERK2 [Panicum virgatum]|uniref:proline-rich receptor-like protein kinase PERK2 n=1 Tax=Panicum virgatum TaxID=38727 RepID=UPI0019D6108F|nr:proline-rich receptor-like protein kinase PERK2 [Panicum virgatum]